MSTHPLGPNHHYSHRSGWLRATVLGANDGIVSTASLIVGVAAASPDKDAILIAGVAGLVAGALSMSAGEYVSVSTQLDTERADLRTERRLLRAYPEAELDELTDIYVDRGLDRPLARKVAVQLTEQDALAAHARDEIGMSDIAAARPIQAALASAAAFAAGAALPLAAAAVAPLPAIIIVVAAASLSSLALLGALAAKAGGARKLRAAARVTGWGAFAMAATAVIGSLIGAVV